MEFAEVLAQVIDLLAREKRLSYRALKLRFNLDDEYLEGLKEDLVYNSVAFLESMQYLLKVHRGLPGQHGCCKVSLRVMVMVGKARKMRKMGSVIPTPQRPVSELLI